MLSDELTYFYFQTLYKYSEYHICFVFSSNWLYILDIAAVDLPWVWMQSV